MTSTRLSVKIPAAFIWPAIYALDSRWNARFFSSPILKGRAQESKRGYFTAIYVTLRLLCYF